MVEQAPSLSRGRRDRRRRSSRADRLRRQVAGSPVLRSWQIPTRWALVAVAVAALALGVYAGFQHHDAAQVQQADELGLHGDPAAALRVAGRVSGGPARTDALMVQGQAAAELGRYGQAASYFTLAAQRDPESWQVHYDLAVVSAADGDRVQAAAEMARARALNPRLPAPAGLAP